MQMAQNERLEEHKCCCALFTGRTNVNVFHFLYGDKDVMQLSCISEEMNKCTIRNPTTIPHLLFGGNRYDLFSKGWQINDR